MPSCETLLRAARHWLLLAKKDFSDLALGWAFWASLLITIVLTGYSYLQAVDLYGHASRAAVNAPELARGLSPLDGIFVPTMGSLYLTVTLLFPVVVIRTIAAEKQSGSLKLLLQMPYSISAIMAAKLAASLMAWGALVIPSLVALGLWLASGGHVHTGETVNLVLGHFLFALAVAGFSLIAAAATRSQASAAIAALGITIGLWVLDFASTSEGGLIRDLGAVSLIQILRTFEHGIFSVPALLGSVIVSLGCITVAGVWLHPGRPIVGKWGRSCLVCLAMLVLIAAAFEVRLFRDVTENRRNSFTAAEEAALRSIPGLLTIDVHLAASDPRMYDLGHSILGKLRRTMRAVSIVTKDSDTGPALVAGSDDDYGKIFYRYGARRVMNRSTSEDEVLPLIFDLAGVPRPTNREADTYSGYPMVADTRIAEIVFYCLLPIVALLAWCLVAGRLPVRLRRREH